MELDIGWCLNCSKQLYDTNALYCGSECANLEYSGKTVPVNSTLSPPSSPPSNLRFSIAITPNIYHASESNARALSPPSSASSSYTDSNLSSSLTSVCTIDKCYIGINGQDNDDAFFDDYNPCYYSTSNPIDIPTSRTKADSKMTEQAKPVFGFGEGSFGKKIDF
ncbi:16344_t:CDS:1 [Dentiscutata erythropus]|uniref:16344_t:CDS:1 n=1 Tax=Dentiscutata erythropus TaxID=1348616 RepID=A0A9N9F4J2_9GLOM|nr:16344_t:CDS:1 [Dentiscutata erythropus]